MATRIPDNDAVFTLAELVLATGGTLLGQASAEARVMGVMTDSRRVRQGGLYVALRGEHHDGHGFVAQAQAAGALAALVDSAAALPVGMAGILVADTARALGEIGRAHRMRWGGRVIAITGSAGKTTTKELTAAALSAVRGPVARTEGNLNNLIGVPMTLLTLDPSSDRAVIEIGTSARGEIARLAEIAQPELGVVTTVAAAHTAGIGTVVDVAHEKAALLRALDATGVAIYSADSAVLCAEVDDRVKARRLRFGQAGDAEIALHTLELTASGRTRCGFRTPVGGLQVELQLLGVGPALDAAAALAVVWAEHGSHAALDTACAALAAVPPVPGRLVPCLLASGALVLDDSYNANPASTAASLHTLAALATARGGRALAVLGDMKELGAESVAEHRRVGERCVELGVQTLVACGAEMTHAAQAARHAGDATLRVVEVADALAAVECLDGLQSGDVVLIKGSRSMAMERLVPLLLGGSR